MARHDATVERYELIRIFGAPALFTESRINKRTVPKELHIYDDDNKGIPIEIGTAGIVNFFGTVITAFEIDKIDPASRRNAFRAIKAKNWKPTGHMLDIDEYLGIAGEIDKYRKSLIKASGIIDDNKEDIAMTTDKTYAERKAAAEEKRAQRKRMYRLKIEIKTDRKVIRYGIEKKIFFRDKNAALEALEKYENALSDAISCKTPWVNIEGTVIRSGVIQAYKVKLREPEVTNEPELPDKLVEDEDDD